jgi:hypothetical protein
MQKIIRAGFLYFVMVLGSGFVLGAFRVPFLVPRMGERWAELAEMPIMSAVIFFSSGFILRRYPDINQSGKALTVGLLALALSVSAELLLATVLQAQTLAQFIASRDKVSGSVYIVLLLVFALLPWLRVRKMRA